MGCDFTCPKCGSHCFGSSGVGTEALTRHCHGYIVQPDGSLRACRFSWPESHDRLYGLGPPLKLVAEERVDGEGEVN
jgi:hypothetical protein